MTTDPAHRPTPFYSSRGALLGCLLLLALAAAFPAAASEPDPVRQIRLLDPQGEPVAGARVEVLRPVAGDNAWGALRARLLEGRTGEDGAVEEPLPRLEGLLVLADAPGYEPAMGWVSADDSGELVLTAGRSRAGRVLSSTGRPVASGRACARWITELPEWRSRRSWERCAEVRDGRFEIRGLDGGEVELTVEAPDHLPAVRSLGASAGNEPALEVVLQPGVRVRGQVVGLRGQGVAGARVESPGAVTVEADGEGRFNLAVPTLPAQISADAPGYREGTVQVEPPAAPAARRGGTQGSASLASWPNGSRDPASGESAETGLEARANRLPEEVTLALEASPEIQLTALGMDGRSLETVSVWLERFVPPTEWRSLRREVETEEGAVTLELPEGGLWRLRLGASGHRDLQLPETVVEAGRAVDLGTLQLDGGSWVSGRVFDEASGEGLAGVEVRLVPRGTAWIQALRQGRTLGAVSGDDGAFRVTGVDGGGYELRLAREGYAASVRELDVAAREPVNLGDLGLAPGGRYPVRLVDRLARPIPGVSVRLYSESGETLEPLGEWRADDGGGLEIQGVEEGLYRFEVRGRRLLLSEVVHLVEGEEETVLVLPQVRLSGLVTRGGQPVDGGWVTLQAEHDPGRRRGTVLVQTRGDFAEGTLRVGGPDSLLEAEIAADGTFEIADAPAGPVELTLTAWDGTSAVRRIEIPEAPTAWATLDLDGLRLEGRAVDAETGEAVPGTVRLLAPTGVEVTSTGCASDGSFQLDQLEAGTYALHLSARGYRDAFVEALRVEPGLAPLELALEAADSGALHLSLARSDGSAVGSAPVTLVDGLGRSVRSSLTDPYGQLEVDALAPGRYAVVWSDPVVGTGASEAVEVGPGDEPHLAHRLEVGGGLRLECVPCAGQALQDIALYSDSGVDVGPFLPTAASQRRFSADGSLTLGRLSAGRYLLRARVTGRSIEQGLSVPVGGLVVVPLHPGGGNPGRPGAEISAP